MFRDAISFVTALMSEDRGRNILFVGTKRQAQDAIREEADARRAVLHQPALARRPADELPDRAEVDQAAARPRSDADGRSLREDDQEGAHQARPRARDSGEEPLGHQEHEPPARRALRHRRAQGRHRGQGGEPPRHPDHRGRRHELLARRASTTSSPATTTRCGPCACSPRASPTPWSRASSCARRARRRARKKRGGPDHFRGSRRGAPRQHLFGHDRARPRRAVAELHRHGERRADDRHAGLRARQHRLRQDRPAARQRRRPRAGRHGRSRARRDRRGESHEPPRSPEQEKGAETVGAAK